MIGKTISHYEIVEKLGQGGMGVVYKAADKRLPRFVAIKMLSPELASDESRRKRLVKEAQAASSLNHPNICTIYEIDEADGVLFVAMEFIQGHTLTEELSRGPMSLKRMLDVATQVAEALDQAHTHNIVHRDIKPSNILITQDGKAKVVDFGLARVLMQTDPEIVSEGSTLEQSLTETGQVLGSVHFMSPEQIRGTKADARSDIFSFGVVLYAMLTGTLPFQGKTVFEVFTSILGENPEAVANRDQILPRDLGPVLNKALAKKPEDRYSSIKELLSNLKKIQQQLMHEAAQSPELKKTSAGGIVIPAAITERRHVTIAVSHLVRYAELIEYLPPAEAENFLRQIRDIAGQIVKRQGGVLNHFSGEEMMIICGLPGAHEDDCLRAVRAVLELHAQVRDLSPQVEDSVGQPIRLQSGISTGLVMAELLEGQDWRYRITGNVVQLATRLASQADPDEVFISPECHRLVTSYFETAAAEPVFLRSKAPAVTPFRILGESSLQSRLEAAQRTGFTPFAGRGTEMNTLLTCFEKARQREGQFVAVVGDSGMGKSRLLYEFRNILDRNSVRVLQGRCQSTSNNISYFPFVDALRDLLKVRENDPEYAPEEVVARIREIDASLESFIPIFLHLLPMKLEPYTLPKHLQGEDLRLAIREAVSAILTLSARRVPLVLILEAWHWCDEASQEVLKQLVEMIPGCSILIVVAYRPEPSLPMASLPNHTTIHLSPLDESLSVGIMKSVLNVDHFPEDLGKLIHDRTGGNPFFLEEVCHALCEEGKIRCEDGKAILTSPLDQFRLPDSVEAVIRARLDRLNLEGREILHLAAVIGREFGRGVLQRVMQQGATLLQSLENLKSLGLIQQIHVLPEAIYKFKHALIRQVAYESLLQHRRKELHDRVACVMEELYSDRLEEQAEVLAHHFSQAEQWVKAVRYGRLSAQKAGKLGQFSEALQCHERVHAWALKLPAQQTRQELVMDALLSQERLCETLGKRERQQQIIDELRSIVGPAGDQSKTAEIYRRQADLNTLLHRFDAAEEALQKSLEISRDLSDIAAERNALCSLGFLRWYQGRYAEGAEICETVISIDRQTDEVQNLARDLTSQANMLRHLKEYERALECLEEALKIYEEKADPAKQSATLIVVAGIYRDLGNMEKALQSLKRALEVSAGNQLFILQGYSVTAIANIYWQQGKVEESLHLHQEGLAINRRSRHAEGLVQSLRAVGEILLSLGKQVEALPYHLESADLFAQLGDQDSEAKMRMSAAAILEQENRFAEAKTNWMRVRELRGMAQDESGELEALEGIAHVSRLNGDDALTCTQFYSQALTLAEKTGNQAKTADLLNSMGILEWNREEYHKALEHYEKALKIFEDLADQVHVGLMLNSVGATLTRISRLEDAQAYLKRAVEVNSQTKQYLLEGHSWAALAEVWYRMGSIKEALQCYETSRLIRSRIGDLKGEGWMLYHLARMYAEMGAQEESDNSLTKATQMAGECADQKLQDACSNLHQRSAGR